MDQAEIRLRLIEAAARSPLPHQQGYAAGVLATAQLWEAYVVAPQGRTLGLPKKAV